MVKLILNLDTKLIYIEENLTRYYLQKYRFEFVIFSSSIPSNKDFNFDDHIKQYQMETITTEDIVRNSTFSCNVEIDDTILEPEEEET